MKELRSRLGPFAFLTALSGILTLGTVIAAPLPLMLIHRNLGRWAFLLALILMTATMWVAQLPSVAVMYIALAGMTLLFCEGEELGLGFTASIATTLLAVLGIGAIGVGIWMEQTGANPEALMRQQIDAVISQLSTAQVNTANIDKDAVFHQIPSAIVIALVLGLWMNALLAERMEKLFGSFRNRRPRESLLNWRLPDFLIWVALASAGAAFLEFSQQAVGIVGTNIFNVMVVLYFFQGLAVSANFFETKQISSFWRVLFYFLVFSQFFLFVAAIGFADYWMNFRARMKAPPKESPSNPLL